MPQTATPDGKARVIAGERPSLARSLWTDTAGAAPGTPPLRGDARVDVAVVGAGYTGLSAALHLAERGVDVAVLEGQSPGWGASGRNGGQVIPGLKEDPDDLERALGSERGQALVTFSGAAPDVVFDLIARHGIECGAVRAGWIQPAHTPDRRAALERRVEQWARRGAPVEMLHRDAAARLIGSDAWGEAALDRRGGSVHPLNYALGLARAAMDQGARVHGDSPVTALERVDDGWRLRTPGGVLSAAHVILATNGYSGAVQDRLRRSVVPVCSIQVATEPLSDNVRGTIFPEGHVASDMRRLMFYFRTGPGGRMIMGGRGAYSDGGIARQMARLRTAAERLFPQLQGVSWTHHWGGHVAMTTDHLPHLHDVDHGLTAALGYNGRGVAMATAMGRALADHLADKGVGQGSGLPGFPATPLHPVPLHGLRQLAVTGVVAWSGLRDRLERCG